jgi:hypothetical protein
LVLQAFVWIMCHVDSVFFTTKWAMILRSPAEHENGGIFLRVVLPATRHSRARGNPGLFSAELTWIPAFAGMTEPSGPWSSAGAKRNPGSSCYRLSPHRYFRRRSRRVRIIKTPPCGLKPSGDRPNFVLFVSFPFAKASGNGP